MLQASVNDSTFDISFIDDDFYINDKKIDWQINETATGSFHVLDGARSINARVESIDKDSKVVNIMVNNTVYSVQVKDRMDLLLKKMGFENQAASKENSVKAPMPGLILDVMVEEGATVSKGDPLLILEAMKMENIIKSPADGTVSSLKVKVGESVEKNHTMIML
ncbi:MAG: acetyl-CoA carboxylase biotin carboxyl carrier protein subunit [Cyclobacteriaceae bacterium]